MEKEEIVYSVSVESGQAGKSLSDLKKEFKEANSELSKLTVGTKEYYDQLKKIAAVKDEMGDLRETIESFQPDQKLKALGNAVSLVGNGFAAAQGAMVLFGNENKELEKTLIKVQAAMAFSQAIQSLQGLGDAFQLLKSGLMATAIGTKIATAAQWLWNAAMNANPVMLIISGLIAMTAAVYALVKATDSAEVSQEKLNEMQRIANENLEKNISLIERKNKLLIDNNKFEIELLRKQGASEKEIYDAQKKNIEERINQLNYLKGFRGKLTAEESAEMLSLTRQKALNDAERTKNIYDDLTKQREQNSEHNRKIYEDNQKAYEERNQKAISEGEKARADYEAHLKKMQEIQVKAKEETDAWAKSEADKMIAENNAEALAAAELAVLKNEADMEAQILLLEEKKRIELENTELTESEKSLIKERYRQEEERLDFENTQKRLELASNLTSSLQSLSDIYFLVKNRNLQKGSAAELAAAKKQFNINKALSIASATITGIQSVMSAYQSGLAVPIVGPATGAIYAVMAGIVSAANIAKIASQKFNPGGGGGGGGGDLGAGASVSVPSISPPSQGSTQLNPDGTIKTPSSTKQPIIKAVVVETDITKTQMDVGVIESRSVF